jgi:hypothetical protein
MDLAKSGDALRDSGKRNWSLRNEGELLFRYFEKGAKAITSSVVTGFAP